jgi:hypothetical protein
VFVSFEENARRVEEAEALIGSCMPEGGEVISSPKVILADESLAPAEVYPYIRYAYWNLVNKDVIIRQPDGIRLHTDNVPGLDEGIAHAVTVLRRAGVPTYESCEGGSGHAFPEPTVRFGGNMAEGFAALAVAMQHPEIGLRVYELRRVWRIDDGEPTGPWWDLVFRPLDD